MLSVVVAWACGGGVKSMLLRYGEVASPRRTCKHWRSVTALLVMAFLLFRTVKLCTSPVCARSFNSREQNSLDVKRLTFLRQKSPCAISVSQPGARETLVVKKKKINHNSSNGIIKICPCISCLYFVHW